MAPHNHHCNNFCHHTQRNPNCCSSCCCSCNCNSCSSSPTPHPPPISPDQILQSMLTTLIRTQSFPKPHQVHSQSLLQDLISRVSALESSLSQLSSRTPPSVRPRRQASPPPLREWAAKTIQARFRRFLVRRSQTLRDLKRLASIKSSASALRLSISGDAGMEPDAISQEAMDLLLQLDSIQSSDSMIRDGKRSISRELMRMLEFVDKVLVRERRSSLMAPLSSRSRSGKRVAFADNGRGVEEEVEERVSRVLEEKEKVFDDGNGAFHAQNAGFELSPPQPLQMELRVPELETPESFLQLSVCSYNGMKSLGPRHRHCKILQ